MPFTAEATLAYLCAARNLIAAAVVAAAAGAFLYLHPPVATVARDEIGVRTNQLTGGVTLWREGSVFVLPGLFDMHVYSLRDQVYRPEQARSASGPRRVIAGAIGLGVAACIFAASRVASAPVWVPAITNVPLQNASDLADRLDRAGIKYKLDRGGSEVLVAEEDVARARVTLAKDGLPGGSRPGRQIGRAHV